MKIFLDTSVLSDSELASLTDEVVSYHVKGDQFCVSSISHFQIKWGYSIAARTSENYDEFLRSIHVEITPVTKTDAEEAARMKPSPVHILGALIASTVKKYNAKLWTFDRDFLRFLPKLNVRLLSR